MTDKRTCLDEEAWRWLVRRDRSDWSSSDERDLSRWLDQALENRAAFLQAQSLWRMLDTGIQADAPAAGVLKRSALRPVSRRTWLVGTAAGLAASVAGLAIMVDRAEPYATVVGEIRRVPLADGSVATINTASRIEVALTTNEREVRLTEGEAWFEVAKDRERPFVVLAGPIRVVAVGTAFSVRRNVDTTDVLVTEGVVELSVGGARTALISAGNRATIDLRHEVVERRPIQDDAIERTLAWRSGRLFFVDEPIGDAVAEINRYNRRKIVLRNPELSRHRFDGVLHTDEPDSFARSVAQSFDVEVDFSSPDRIVLE